MKFIYSVSSQFIRRGGSAFSTASHRLLSEKFTENSDLVFIRHAQSAYNVACEEYRKQHKIPYVWSDLCSHQGFYEEVFLNPQFIDCPLT